MRGQTFPGLNRDQVKEQCPGLQIPEDQLPLIDEEGWFKQDHEETFEEIVARIKSVLFDFKNMAKREDLKDKTLFAVTHGQFIHYLCCNLMGSPDKDFTQSGSLIPLNNSLTIVDFIQEERPAAANNAESTISIKTQLIAHNLQIVNNQPMGSPHDFKV